MNLDHIHQSMNGQHHIVCNDLQALQRPTIVNNNDDSDSDDGGFLPHRSRRAMMHCCRPIISYANQFGTIVQPPFIITGQQLPLHYVNQMRSTAKLVAPTTAAAATTSTMPRPKSSKLTTIAMVHTSQPHQQNLLQTVDVEHENRPMYQNISSLRRMMRSEQQPLSLQTPSRTSRIVSSSPATADSSVRSPQATFFSDLSSVQQPSSIDRTFSSPPSNVSHLRYLQERYAQELPSLRAIHEEKQRMVQGFVPLQVELHSPSLRQYHEYRQQSHLPIVQRNRARAHRSGQRIIDVISPARHFSVIETSPESQTSSSGFGSKNTSTQPNSSHSDRTRDFRQLPPYRSPPRYNQAISTHWSEISAENDEEDDEDTPYTMEHWLELINRLNADSTAGRPKAVDVGSVDGHYEFDPSTPTPSASTPTGTRDDMFIDHSHHHPHQFNTATLMHTQSLQPYQRKRVSKYDNIEARVQAMKEEFHSYRKRQAMQNSDVGLESAC